MSSRVDLVGRLPRDLLPGALVSHGSFLINLEGECGGGVSSVFGLQFTASCPWTTLPLGLFSQTTFWSPIKSSKGR